MAEEVQVSQSQDQVVKALSKDGQAVIVAIDARQLLQDSLDRVKAWPPAMLHLGQALMGAALIQALPDRNENEKLELQWRVEGPFGHLFAECRDRNKLRGTVLNPRADVADLQTSMGKGLLQVRRLDKNVWTGIVESQGNVNLDLLDYLEKSEQKNCAMNLWVDLAWDDSADPDQPFVVKHALGFLVHVLPKKTKHEDERNLLQWDRHLRSLGPISNWVFKQKPVVDILSFVSAEFEPKIISQDTPRFFCSCSEERAERALGLSGGRHAEEGQKNFEVQCEYCGRVYQLEATQD